MKKKIIMLNILTRVATSLLVLEEDTHFGNIRWEFRMKNGNSGRKKPSIVFTAYLQLNCACRFAKLELNCQLTPNYNSQNLVPNNKTWPPIKIKIKNQCLIIKIWSLIIKTWFLIIKKIVPNNKNSVPNNRYYVPNNKKSDPSNKKSDPNNNKSDPGNKKSDSNNKKIIILVELAPHSRVPTSKLYFCFAWQRNFCGPLLLRGLFRKKYSAAF